MAKKNTTIVIDKKLIKQNISAYKAQIKRQREEVNKELKATYVKEDKIYKLEEAVVELERLLQIEAVLSKVGVAA